jgi:hypothetical protein
MKQRFTKLIFLSFLFFGLFSNAAAQKSGERFVLPVDEGGKDASFKEFRDKLINAVQKRDRKFIISVLDPKIMNNYGGGVVIKDFQQIWKINSPESELWDELLAILTNGGKFEKAARLQNKQFCAPYTFSTFPNDLDAFDYSMIFGNNVNLRDRPDLKSDTVAALSYNIVKVDYEKSIRSKARDDKFTWLRVETLGGKKGFVSAKYVRSAFDYRACLEKIKGIWKMTALIAGD